MIDQITKVLSIITIIIPMLSLFDKSGRFLHTRRFHKVRQKAMLSYKEECKKDDILSVEKDCAAQVLASSEKVSHLEVDYLLKHFPHCFFEILQKLVYAKDVIKYLPLENEAFEWSSKRNKIQLRNFIIKCTFFYFSSILIFSLNNIIVFILTTFTPIKPLIVSNFNYAIIQLSLFIIGGLVALLSGILINSAISAYDLYDDLKIKHIPN